MIPVNGVAQRGCSHGVDPRRNCRALAAPVRITLFVALLVLGLAAPTASRDGIAQPQERGVLRTRDAAHDFGDVLRATPLKARITIENTGKEIIRINRAHGSCSCVNVVSPAQITPGEVTDLEVIIDTSRLIPGLHKKQVLLETSDAGRPRWEIPITWTVIDLIQPVKTSLIALSGVHDRDLVVPVEFERGTAMKVVVTGARSLQKRFVVQSFREIDPGLRYQIELRVAKAAKALRTTDTLEIDINCADGGVRKVRLRVSISMRERLEFRPTRNIAFRKEETRKLLLGRKVERRVHLVASNDDIAFDITGHEVTGDFVAFDVKIVPIRPRKEFAIVVRIPEYLDTRVARARVLITTTDPNERVKRLPLHAQFERRH